MASYDVEGPAVLSVPARRAGAVGVMDWVLDDGWPGVRVVEGPVDPRVPGGNEGEVIVTVDPGARAVLGPGYVPWRIGVPSGELVSRARESCETGARAARAKARDSVTRVGWLRSEMGEPALSVKLIRSVCILRRDGLENRVGMFIA